MTLKTLQKWQRYSYESLMQSTDQDPRGQLFLADGKMFDASSVEILLNSVDTVRQLYRGTLKAEQLHQIAACAEAGVDPSFSLNVGKKTYFLDLAVGSAYAGGYQIRLQSNEIGIIILLKNRYSKVDAEATHLKIECSPKLIQSMDAVELQALLDAVADRYLSAWKPAGVAVHLAVDVQGWAPDQNFMQNFVCRSKRISDNRAVSEWTFEGADLATSYNQGQSMLFGKANGFQCAIYNKTKECLAHDKLDYFQALWSKTGGEDWDSSAYNPDQDVWRIEVRFHQSIIHQYALGTLEKHSKSEWLNPDTGELIQTDTDLLRFIDTVPHLTGLWRSATMSFRLDYKVGKLIDPFWQYISEDSSYFATYHTTDYKRVKKTPALGNEKNIALVLGNALSIFARQGLRQQQVIQFLRKGGFWDEILAYYQRRGVSQQEVFRLISDGLKRRRQLGKAA